MVSGMPFELPEPPGSDLSENTPLVRDGLFHDDVECTDSICRDEKERIGIDFVNVADLAPTEEREGQVRLRHDHQTRISDSSGNTCRLPASRGSTTSVRNSSTCCGARPMNCEGSAALEISSAVNPNSGSRDRRSNRSLNAAPSFIAEAADME